MRLKSVSLRSLFVLFCLATTVLCAQTPAAADTSSSPVSLNLYNRTRTDANDWYSAPPYTSTYPYVEQLDRFSIAQRIRHFDWLIEAQEANVFDVPTTAVSSVTAQGQLGLGGTYYAANTNTLPAAVSLRGAFLRYHGSGTDSSLRVGRFEFLDGTETTPKDSSLLWLQANRMQQHLVGNFGFANAQRSFDGVDGHYGRGTWDVTAMAGRPTQGVFNMNANPELNVDVQYLAYTKHDFQEHFIWRVFALGYHDGRTGITKTDNRPLAVRQADHKNIRIGSYGSDFLASVPAGPGSFDFLFWGVLQNGQWGELSQHSGAVQAEAGYRFSAVASQPWIRGGYFRSTGDNNPADSVHNTFFQGLSTPRVYARFPFFNEMNNRDEFVQLIDRPSRKLELRSDLHFLQLTSSGDLWYQGGGAFDNHVFGYTGRPSGGHNSFASTLDISSDYQLTHALALNLYYSHSFGRSVIAADYPAGRVANFGYLELVYKWGIKQRASISQ